MREFALIDALTQQLAARRKDTRLGIGDDAAVLAVPEGHELTLCTDTLISGRHFPADARPEDIGFRSLAVNLSDTAAMGATPAWATVALSAPKLTPAWSNAFIAGLADAATQAGIDIVGGDTTRGALSISVTVAGHVPQDQAITRAGAQAGDLICVTGTLGDAALGLKLWPQGDQFLTQRLMRPQWRNGQALLGAAHAALDISDGFLSDLGHILKASQCGAHIQVDNVPQSAAFTQHCPAEQRYALQLAGGDDYELLFTLPEAKLAQVREQLDCNVTVVGRITAEQGTQLVNAQGQKLTASEFGGWDHFSRP